ncbi:hypothetical protein H6P81_021469 [Aristolochia fimbriata]|uniref:Uncharacterized protein n=1 Tax=Aristolochia fimbriata TaxID=158543 RepID=A0AAV7DTJ7_ARIFI|nr:hypothetical protein H6P81_021469 [Aristolochia fimbriata]
MTQAFGYLKRVIVTPRRLPAALVEFLHFDIQSTGQKSHCAEHPQGPSQCFVLIKQPDSPCPHSVLSRLFDAGRPPKGPLPVPPRRASLTTRLAAGAARAVHRQPTGSGLGPPCPAPEPILFPGCSPWRPDAVMSTTRRGMHSVLRIFKGRRAHRTPRRRGGALSSRWTLPPAEPLPVVGRLLNRKDNSSPRPPPTPPDSLTLPPTATPPFRNFNPIPFRGSRMHAYLTGFPRLLGSTNPCASAAHMEPFPLRLQSSHLNICYYHQDLHRRPPAQAQALRFSCSQPGLLLIEAWLLPRRPVWVA